MLNKNKFTITKTPFSFKFIPFYFFFIIMAFFCIFKKLDVDTYIYNSAIIKAVHNFEENATLFSDYNGVVSFVFKKEQDFVLINEPLFNIIEYNNKDHDRTTKEKEKTIYSPINGKIETIYIQSGNKIQKNKRILKFKTNNIDKYYIESLFETSEIHNISIDQAVYIKTQHNDIFIGKVVSIYPDKNNKSKHYIKIDIIETNTTIKENEIVEISILNSSEGFTDWFFKNIN